ncbi:MAG: acetyl-CoA carboxylase biotin carboxyl carrier protein [Lentisphaeria bacterium]|nr:acetyl-CoA carboxylase biotin carboxyl carrier protein [Lentisphaeria bacterium]
MQIEEIKTIVRMMREYELTEVKIEVDGCHLSISRASAPTAQAAAPVVVAAAPAPAPTAPEPAPAPAKAAPQEAIESPLVGTFYRAASPEAKPFVEVGDRVTADTVVGIIEAMKVMNEVKAEKSGVIKEVLVDNGDPVEYGQKLFVIG